MGDQTRDDLILFRCRCGQALKAPREAAGRKVRCPKCGRVGTLSAAPASRESQAPAAETGAVEGDAADVAAERPRGRRRLFVLIAAIGVGVVLVGLAAVGVVWFLGGGGPGGAALGKADVIAVCAGDRKVRFIRADGAAVHTMKHPPRIKTIEGLPDGRTVAIVSGDAKASRLVDVARLASRGEGAVQACPALDAFGAVPAISANGRHLAFVLKDRFFVVPAGSVSLADLLEDDGPEAAAALAKGAKPVFLDRGGVADPVDNLLDIAWSPDGSKVALTTREALFIHAPTDGKTQSFAAPETVTANLFWDRAGRYVYSWRAGAVWRFEPKAGGGGKVLDAFGTCYAADLGKFLYLGTYLGVHEKGDLSCRALFARRPDGGEMERLATPVDTGDDLLAVHPDFTFKSLWPELKGTRTLVYHDWYNDDKMSKSNTVGVSDLGGAGYQVLRDASGGAVPHVTPDKQHLCYKIHRSVSFGRSAEQEFVRMHWPTGRKETMPLGEKAPGKLVSWTADASRLAFKKLNPNAPPSFIIYDFSQKKSVAELKMRTYGYDSVTWSPDGNRLAFLYGQHQETPRCFVWDVPGQGVTDVVLPAKKVTSCIVQVAWSPDGSRSALLVHSPSPDNMIDVFLADGSGRDPRKFVSLPLNTLTQYSRIAWHPDGQRFTLAGLIFPVGEGAAKTEVPEDTATVEHSYWSPDGRYFVLYDTDYGRVPGYRGALPVSLGRLFIGNADGTNLREVNFTPRFGHIEHGPFWSPDGRFVAYLGSCHPSLGYCFFVASLDPANGQVAVLPIEKQKPFEVLWKPAPAGQPARPDSGPDAATRAAAPSK